MLDSIKQEPRRWNKQQEKVTGSYHDIKVTLSTFVMYSRYTMTATKRAVHKRMCVKNYCVLWLSNLSEDFMTAILTCKLAIRMEVHSYILCYFDAQISEPPKIQMRNYVGINLSSSRHKPCSSQTWEPQKGIINIPQQLQHLFYHLYHQ